MLEIKKKSGLSLFQKPGNQTREFDIKNQNRNKEFENNKIIMVTILPLFTRRVELEM